MTIERAIKLLMEIRDMENVSIILVSHDLALETAFLQA